MLWGRKNTANKYHWHVWHEARVLTCLATLGFPPVTACVLSQSTLLTLQVALQGNCLKPAPACMHFPGLSHSGSGSWIFHKGTDSVQPVFCALPRPSQLRQLGAWRAHSPQVGQCILSPPLPSQVLFPGRTAGAPSQVCCVSLLGSSSLAATLLADVDHPESQEVLVSNKSCLQFGRGCLSGAAIAPFRLWLPSPACLQQGMGRSTAG